MPSGAGMETLAPTDFAGEVDHLLATPAEPLNAEGPTAEQPLEPGRPDTGPQAVEDLAATSATGTAAWIWGGAGMVACFGLGLLAAAWFLEGGDKASPVQVATDVEQSTSPSATAEPTREAAGGDAKTLPQDDPAQQTNDAVAVNKPVLPPTSPDEADTGSEATAEAPLKVATLPDLPPASVEAPQREPSRSEPADTLPPIDPLGIDSANLDLLLIPDADLNTQLDAEPEMQPEPIAAEEALVVADAKPMRFAPGSASRGPTFAEAFAEGELDSRLAMNLPAVAWRGTPLDVAVDELTRLSGVPITLTPEALTQAAVAPGQPIQVESENATVRELAEKLARAVRLEVRQTPFGLTLAKKGMETKRSHTYDLKDLAGSEADARKLAELTQECVAPTTWQAQGASIEVEGSSVVVEQLTSVHYRTLLFYERLRLARGLPTQSAYPRSLLTIEPRLAGLSPLVSQSTTFAFVDWTPLVDVFAYWRQASGLGMLVDWQHLGDIDLRPMATMAASANNVPWGESLDACLAPLELAWFPVDHSTICITAAGQAADAHWVEFYPNTTAVELREHIEAAASPDAMTTAVVVDDPSGEFVIVRGNREVHQAALR